VYALIFAVSEREGLEHYQIFEKSINHTKFNEYLDQLYIDHKHEKVAVFLDNLRVHLKEEVTMKMDELGIK